MPSEKVKGLPKIVVRTTFGKVWPENRRQELPVMGSVGFGSQEKEQGPGFSIQSKGQILMLPPDLRWTHQMEFQHSDPSV
jgi:hypothetical protein